MLCRKPFMQANIAFGCGQCMPCRFNRRRVWTHRMMLESLVHPAASFLTLTYKEEPIGGTLVPRDAQLFLKRLRKNMGAAPGSLRYFIVGEYGDHTQRPHYHAALFGLGPESHDLVSKSWGLGFVKLGTLTYDSACYVAGYVTKKMTSHDDIRLNGRHPEFARMSLRPGLGAVAVSDVAEALSNRQGWDHIDAEGDVPSVLMHGSKRYPLGRYLRQKLRLEMGLDKNAPENWSLTQSAEMLVVFKDYLDAGGTGSLKQALLEKNRQKALNMENRSKIYASKKGTGL